MVITIYDVKGYHSDFYMLAPEELAGRLFLGVFLLFLCYGTGFGFMQLKFPEKLFSKR